MKTLTAPLFRPALIAILALTPVLALANDGVESAAAEENLEQVKDGPYAETWVNPDVDFTAYNKLMGGSAVFDYRDVGPARPYRSINSRSSSKTVFGISEEDRKEFEEIVGEAFREEVAKGKHFTITDQADAQTIMVRGALVDIISRVPPSSPGMTDTYLSSVGEATLAIELIDPTTGETLAVVAERGIISSTNGQMNEFGAQRTTPGRVRSEIKFWAGQSGKKLRKVLDEALAP